jgi:hypothetical protein
MNVATTYAWIQPTNKGNHSVNYNLSLNPNGGNVGIGTTSPDERLHVNGKILVSANDIAYAAGYFTKITSNYADNPFVLESRAGTLMSAKDYGRTLAFYAGPDGSTAEVMRVDEDGKVGIGTTTPNYLLDVESAGAGARVYNTVGSTSVYLTTPAAQNASLYFGPSTDNDEGHITYRTASSSMAFTTNTSEAMRIDSSGNVGIGTSSPASPLHVYSDNAATDTSGGLTIEQDGTGDALLQFLLTGSKRWVVGIDNDANNNFKISGTSDLGTDNGLTITNSTYNVGIGTTSPSAKLDVVGLVNINDGSNNVMISSRNTAMAASSGSNNTAVGDVAGFINASGNNNSFFGRAAGYYSTGYNNVLLGMEAGYGGATSTFSNTVAVGYQALYDLTSGAGNTAVGYQASTNINSGNNNTSVGYQAGYAITSGSSNSFFGTYAGVSTTGSENTAVGHSASFSNTTGTNNVAIGRGAGYTNSTGSGNIFIGYQAGYYETGSNKLYIDNSSASIPLIYGDFNLRAATINGDLTVSGGDFRADSIEINGRSQTSPAPSTGEYGAGSKIVTQFATGTVTAGVVYVASSGAWVQGDADVGSASIGMIAVATDSASAAEMLIEGVIKLSSNAGFSGASAGDVLYLSNTAGELTDTAPSGTGDYVRICGYVVNASQNEVFFSPSKEWRVV